MKLPAIQFYPGDWRKDPGIRALSFHDRGVWLEMILLMHESENRGKLMLAGKPIDHKTLGKLLGIHLNSLTKTLRNLRDLNICGFDEKTGIYYSRRMIRDNEIILKRRECGKLGGNPNFKKGNPNPYKQNHNHMDKQTDKQSITPSVSSSVSLSEQQQTTTEQLGPELNKIGDYLKTTEPFKSGLKGVEHFLARAGTVHAPEQIERALKEIVGWCAKKPEWEKKRKSWPRTIINWIKRNEKSNSNLAKVDKIMAGVGKEL